MIEVSVRKNEIKVSGHAMYAPHGQDIVCAGVFQPRADADPLDRGSNKG